jgi:hypothetical protein
MAEGVLCDFPFLFLFDGIHRTESHRTFSLVLVYRVGVKVTDSKYKYM